MSGFASAPATMLEAICALPAGDCRCVRVSPDGTSVLTVGGGVAEVRDAINGQVGWSRGWDGPAELPVEAVWGLAGDTVTVVSGGRLALMDAVTGADLAVPNELAAYPHVTAIALAGSGVTLAIGTNAGIVLLWQQDTGRVTRLRGGGDPVTALAWRPDGAELCVARPRSAQFWRLPADAMISSVDVGDTYPQRLSWSPDGDLLAVAGLREVRVVDVRTRSEGAIPVDLGGRPTGLGFSRTGASLLAGMPDGSVAVLDRQLQRSPLQPGQLAAGLTEPACLHVNETGLVAVRTDSATVTLFKMPDTLLPDDVQRTAVATRRWAVRVARTMGRATQADAAAPVPEVIARRARFAWAADGWIVQDRASGMVTRYAENGRQRWQVQASPGRLATPGEFVTVSSSDAVAGREGTGGAGGLVTVLDAASGALVARVAGTGIPSWSRHGLAVAAPGRRDLLIYDSAWTTAKPVPVSEGAGDPAWSPDGGWLAAASAGVVVVWDGQSLARIQSVPVGNSPRPGAVAWSRDGRQLAIDRPGGRIAVCQASTGTWTAGAALAQSTIGDSPLVLAWSPDSRLLAIPSARVTGAVDLWDTRRMVIAMSVPRPPAGRAAVAAVAWARDGRFAVSYDDGTVIRWRFSVPPLPGDETDLPFPARTLAQLAAATAATGAMINLPLLADLLHLLLGRDAGQLRELDGHPGVAMLRSLSWPLGAVTGLVVLVAAGLPAAADLAPPDGAVSGEMTAAVEQALSGPRVPLEAAAPPIPELLRELDRVDDSVLMLAMLLGPDAVESEPGILVRLRGQSFTGWTLAPRQRKLLGLRAMLRSGGSAQGQGTGDTRAGIARNGQLPWLLPSELALPRAVLAAKSARGELLFRTRQGSLPVVAQSVVLLLDDTPAAFGAVGVTLRVLANLLASLAIQRHRRCALITLGSPVARFIEDMSDLVHVWADGTVDRPDIATALSVAATVSAQLSDPLDGLPRLVLLTHPYQACPVSPALRVVRVHYPGLPVEDTAPRTHVLAPDAPPDQLFAVVTEILDDRL
jgi:WD40 repeat protein